MRERAATRPSRVKNQKERKDEEMARRRERAIRRPSAPKVREIDWNTIDLDVGAAIARNKPKWKDRSAYGRKK